MRWEQQRLQRGVCGSRVAQQGWLVMMMNDALAVGFARAGPLLWAAAAGQAVRFQRCLLQEAHGRRLGGGGAAVVVMDTV